MTWYGSMSHEFLRHIFAFCLGLVSTKWWRHQMETFSALLAIYAGNSPVPGEFPAQRPVTRSFDISFDLRRNKRLNKQSWGWWFETLLRPLWRQCNEFYPCISLQWCWGSYCWNDKTLNSICNRIIFIWYLNNIQWSKQNKAQQKAYAYGSGHETAAVLLPGFAINW